MFNLVLETLLTLNEVLFEPPSSCSEILEVSSVVRQLVWWALHPIGLDLIPALEAASG